MIIGAYDPSQVSFTFRGQRITQYQDGTFIDVERSSDSWHKHMGSAGDGVRTKDLDRSGTFTLTLMAQSADNDLMQAIFDEDEAFSTGFGTIQVLDFSGTGECHSPYGWVRKAPKWTRAKEAGGVVWVLDCFELEINNNGNLITP